jgi:hypothetical protein
LRLYSTIIFLILRGKTMFNGLRKIGRENLSLQPSISPIGKGEAK